MCVLSFFIKEALTPRPSIATDGAEERSATKQPQMKCCYRQPATSGQGLQFFLEMYWVPSNCQIPSIPRHIFQYKETTWIQHWIPVAKVLGHLVWGQGTKASFHPALVATVHARESTEQFASSSSVTQPQLMSPPDNTPFTPPTLSLAGPCCVTGWSFSTCFAARHTPRNGSNIFPKSIRSCLFFRSWQVVPHQYFSRWGSFGRASTVPLGQKNREQDKHIQSPLLCQFHPVLI